MFKPTKYVELKENVGPIPKGVYRLKHWDEESAEFFPGKKCAFSIIGDWQSKVSNINDGHEAWKKRTSQEDFIQRYFELPEQLREEDRLSESDVYTTCFFDPSLHRHKGMKPLNLLDCQDVN